MADKKYTLEEVYNILNKEYDNVFLDINDGEIYVNLVLESLKNLSLNKFNLGYILYDTWNDEYYFIIIDNPNSNYKNDNNAFYRPDGFTEKDIQTIKNEISNIIKNAEKEIDDKINEIEDKYTEMIENGLEETIDYVDYFLEDIENEDFYYVIADLKNDLRDHLKDINKYLEKFQKDRNFDDLIDSLTQFLEYYEDYEFDDYSKQIDNINYETESNDELEETNKVENAITEIYTSYSINFIDKIKEYIKEQANNYWVK